MAEYSDMPHEYRAASTYCTGHLHVVACATTSAYTLLFHILTEKA